LVGLASRIRTPLTLAGLVVVVLYVLYRQILGLGIFAQVGESSTVTLLSSIIDKVFWLALIALVLGVACYVLTLFLKRRAEKSRSSVQLVDARVDSGATAYRPQHNAQPNDPKLGESNSADKP
jgi:hypothetical protein